MRKKLLFCFCITLLTVTAASAQARQITNFDLEKYRVARIVAEKELRENYEKLGFPSPEELERRREKSRVETGELAAQLRTGRIEQERLDAQREATQPSSIVYARDIIRQGGGYYLGGYYLGGSYYSPYVKYPPRRRGYIQEGYHAAGNFWPTGGRTAPRPLFVRPRTR